MSPIEQAMRQICEEKGLAYESVLETIEAALAAAYRKDYGNRMQNLEAKFNVDDGSVKIWDVKTVVEDQEIEEEEEVSEEEAQMQETPHAIARETLGYTRRGEEDGAEEDEAKFNPKTEVMLSDALEDNPGAKIGDVLRAEQEVPGEFGRMAAMTAKQVITQKLREAEREVMYEEYKEQEGEVLVGTVQRRQGRNVLVDLGRGTALMRSEDQIPGERYMPGDRVKVFVKSVELGPRGPQVLISRTAPELVLELFKVEIPEVADGTVRIESIAREPGSRSKVAVSCADDGVDPIGACIGQRGARIQTIIAELGGEKVDIIEYDTDIGVFVMNALAPAKVNSVELDDEEQMAVVSVDEDQLSLAIGRGGQNVRLAARLTDWRINVAEEGGVIKGSSEGAVDTPMSVSSTPADADGASEEVIDAEVATEIEAAVVEEAMEDLESNADGADSESEDDAMVDVEAVNDGLEAEELPTNTMDDADKEAVGEVDDAIDEQEAA